MLVGVAVLAGLGSTGAWLVGDPPSSSGRLATTSTTTSAPAAESTGPAPPERVPASSGASPQAPVRLALEQPAGTAEPFEAVRIRGTHSGGTRTTFLRLQRWERGAWRTFPVPTRSDRTGRFTTHVELGRPGRYRLRVLDPGSGVASEPVLLVVGRA